MGALDGKLAVITGASRGIGASTARLYAAEGAKVVLLARTEKDLKNLVEEIRDRGGEGVYYPVDLSDGEKATQTAKQILREQGLPDILVNNAGLGRWLFVWETPPEEAELMVKLPYLAAFWMSSVFLPGMLKRGSGRILNVQSPVSITPWGGAAAYGASRAALRSMSKSLHIDLHGTGVTCCDCVFGEVDSNYFEANPGAHDRLPFVSKIIPVSSTEQIAKQLLKLAQNRRKFRNYPFRLAFLLFLDQLFPRITQWVVRKGSYRPRVDELIE